jgi:hypothetical protein
MKPTFTVSTKIRSHSHLVNAEAFEIFKHPKCPLSALDVESETFFLVVDEFQTSRPPKLFTSDSYHILSRFLMALNIVTLGHFDWDCQHIASDAFAFVDHRQQQAMHFGPSAEIYPDVKSTLTAHDVQVAFTLCPILMEEPEVEIQREYLKGIYHLGLKFYDLTFRKEAFFNFYRALEFFVTQRVLKAKNLGNELKCFKEAFSQLAMPIAIIEMFAKELYPLRGNQVAHAQKQQTDIQPEEVVKMKMVTDAVMRKHYDPLIAKIFQQGSPS